MPVSVSDLTEQLAISGLLSAEQLQRACEAAGENASGETLVKLLVKNGELTKFQAQLAYGGKAKNLVMGSYIILEKLGEGGMGQVFKARHKRMKREVALKVLAPKFVKDQNALKRFHREVEAAARLTHLNIVTAFDADEAHGTHYLVMEFVRGQDLGELIKKSGHLPVAKAVDFILQSARGLAYAHDQGVVHRDIKPSNLLLDDSGTVKILDMGLARFDEAPGDDVSQAGLTGTGTLMGTVDYMAPEQAMDSKTADHRADIYSLGCSLYFLITGQPVYREDTIMKRIMAHQSADAPQLPGADNRLQDLFQRMVAKQPADRIQPTTELIAALEAWLADNRGGADPAARLTDATSTSGKATADTTPVASAGEPTLEPQARTRSGKSRTDRSRSLDFDDLNEQPPVRSGRRRSTRTKSKPARGRKPSSKKPSNQALLIGGGGALFALLLLASVLIFKFQSSDGTVTVELEHEVEIESVEIDGREVSFVLGEDNATLVFEVDPGSHKLVLKTVDGVELTTDLGAEPLKIKAGAEAKLKAWVQPQVASNSNDKDREAGELEEDRNATAKVDPPSLDAGPTPWNLPEDAPPPAVAPFDTAGARQHQERWAAYRDVPIEYTNSLGMKFRLIPPGEFLMTRPGVRVKLTKPYYLSLAEVTTGEFKQFADATGYQTLAETNGLGGIYNQGGPKHDVNINWKQPARQQVGSSDPVTQVAWQDAVEFCRWMSDPKTGAGARYRLPTEAEFEFAAAGGAKPETFSEATLSPSRDSRSEQIVTTDFPGGVTVKVPPPTKTAPPNPFGLHEMVGGVWEWCQDWHTNNWSGSVGNDPRGPAEGSRHVLKGGAFNLPPEENTVASVMSSENDAGGWTFGFRVLLEVDSIPPPSAPTEVPEVVTVAYPVEKFGGLATVDLRTKPRSEGLPKYLDKLKAGAPLGEFAAISNPAKVARIISWSIEPVLHRGSFRSIDVRDDGTIVTGGHDGALRLWTPEWQLIKILPGHANSVCAVKFSPDGSRLASVSSSPRDLLAVWDVGSGQLLKFHDVQNWQGELAWSPDGSVIVHASQSGIELISPLTGKRVSEPEKGQAQSLALSPDGSRVATAIDGKLRILDTGSLKELRSIDAGGGGGLDWSGDDRWVAVHIGNGTAILDTRSFQERHKLECVGGIKFSPDSTKIAVGANGSMRIFRTSDWKPLFEGYSGVAARDFAWTPDSKRVWTSEGFIVVETGERVAGLRHHAIAKVQTAVEGDGDRVATMTARRMRIWDGKRGSLLNEYEVANHANSQLLWQPRGTLLLRLDTSDSAEVERLTLIDTESGKVRHSLSGHQGSIWRACWSPDGNFVASVGDDGLCIIWDAATGAELKRLVHDDAQWWVQWAHDGSRIATGSAFGQITVWDAVSGENLKEFKTLSQPLQRPGGQHAGDGPFCFLRDTNQLFYMAGDSGFELLNIRSGQIKSLGQASIGGGNRLSVGWSKDFNLMGVYCGYGEFHLIRQGEKSSFDVRYYTTPHWLNDGKRLLGGDNGHAWVSGFNLRSRRRLGTLVPELPDDAWAALSSDGHYVGSKNLPDQMVIVALHEDGRLLTLSLDEFAEQFNWKNDPAKVKLLE